MKYIKNNIKLIIFIIVIIIIFTLFNMFLNKPVDYKLEYDAYDFHIVEAYNMNLKMYTFDVSNDDHKYSFSVNNEYTRKRKLVTGINTEEQNDYLCMTFDSSVGNFSTVCNKGPDYYDYSLNNKDSENIYNNNEFYISDYTKEFYIWNGYGITNKNTNVDYNFLSNESYTNNLYYQYGDYIIFADYDQKREFNKFYIFDNAKKTISEWKLNYTISLDSYFLGIYNGDLYLYDVTNEVEYRLNIGLKKIKVVSKNDTVYYYENGEFKKINKNILVYNITPFKNNNRVEFLMLDDKLYYKYHGSDIRVRASDLKIKDIVYTTGDTVYYVSDDKLYSFNLDSGEKFLAKYFEWNFDFKNKIYVF